MSAQHIESVHLFEILPNVALGEFIRGDVEVVSRYDDFVIHISEVLNVSYGVTFEFEIAPHDIEYDRHHGMSNVGSGIRRDAADIHANFAV